MGSPGFRFGLFKIVFADRSLVQMEADQQHCKYNTFDTPFLKALFDFNIIQLQMSYIVSTLNRENTDT